MTSHSFITDLSSSRFGLVENDSDVNYGLLEVEDALVGKTNTMKKTYNLVTVLQIQFSIDKAKL